jgi:hypothetical protein
LEFDNSEKSDCFDVGVGQSHEGEAEQARAIYIVGAGLEAMHPQSRLGVDIALERMLMRHALARRFPMQCRWSVDSTLRISRVSSIMTTERAEHQAIVESR